MTGCRRGGGSGRCRGISLLDALVAVAVTALLVALALPAYQQQLIRSGRAVARLALLDVAARQEQFFLDHRQYAQYLTELGLPADPCPLNAQGDPLSAPADGAIYQLELASTGDDYTLTASPLARQRDDGECGALAVDGRGRKSAGGRGGVERCW